MRAAIYRNNKDIRIKTLQTPRINPNELLVKVMACGICGSDVMEWYRIKTAPRVLGHELTGTIEEAGANIRGFARGDRIMVSHHVPCNACHHCHDDQQTVCETLHTTNLDPGGFSEFTRVPALNVEHGTFRLPDEISFDEGTLIEPLGCVIRGQRRAGIRSHHTLLVIGSGVSGLLHIQLACAKGVTRVIATDISEYRLDAARKLGASIAIHAENDVPARVKAANDGRLADRIVVCTGSRSALQQALQCIDAGGTILFFAPTTPGVNLSLPFNEFWEKQMTLTTTYAAAPEDLKEAIRLIQSHTLDVHAMITHRLSLAEIERGFRLVADADKSLKVVIKPHHDRVH
ncbi:MAG: alcohol dehydrogenase catalytic domain-containing protein [Candidatus Bathyarchaeota archaeon]|nr:MAG: alcohol dehydrogenase catalytic domain-containing protein [Candidatus Bathyarchaeota archaeon]